MTFFRRCNSLFPSSHQFFSLSPPPVTRYAERESSSIQDLASALSRIVLVLIYVFPFFYCLWLFNFFLMALVALYAFLIFLFFPSGFPSSFSSPDGGAKIYIIFILLFFPSCSPTLENFLSSRFRSHEMRPAARPHSHSPLPSLCHGSPCPMFRSFQPPQPPPPQPLKPCSAWPRAGR